MQALQAKGATDLRKSGWIGVAMVAALAGCSKKHPEGPAAPPPAPAPAPAPRPLPPNGAPEKLSLPEHDDAGGYRTINSGIGEGEAVWHLRSALNVAALSCDRTGKLGIVAAYNGLLDKQKAAFAAAYRAETKKSGGNTALDRHVTQVYNFFAQPPAQSAFCQASLAVAAEAKDVPASRFAAFAVTALPRLEAPFTDFYRAYERYRIDLAAWEKGDHRVKAVEPAARVALAAAPAAPSTASAQPWRIQLGAYSGDKAAREAWGRISKRLDRVASFEPRYEPVPGKPLVRVQIGPVTDRTEAIALCAAAAAANLDCRPVPVR